MKVVRFVDQDGEHSVPVEEAIRIQRLFHPYQNDQDALNDYITVHWGYVTNQITLLNCGITTWVDDCDVGLLLSQAWYYEDGYLQTKIPPHRGKHVLFHVEVARRMSLVGPTIDHKNRNKLDNRRDNLRSATQSQQNANTIKRTGKYKGVHYNKRDRKFETQIKFGGSRIHLGTYESEEQAARMYDHFAKKYHGEFAVLNFPEVRDG